MTFRSSILAGVNLVRAAIRSPNYVSGSSGWTINQDGSAEFNNIVIRGGTTVGGTALYYDGTPAFGNLIFSISNVAGTDPYGNQYPAGEASYGTPSGNDVSIKNGVLYFGPATNSVNSGSIQIGAFTNGELILTSPPGDANHQDQVIVRLTSGETGQATGSPFAPNMIFKTDDLATAVDILLPGSLIHTDLLGNASLWTYPTPNSGWSRGPAGGSIQEVHYRNDGLDNLVIEGSVHTTSATPNAVIFNIPAGPLRPQANHRVPGIINQAGSITACITEVDTNGNVYITPNISTNGSDTYLQVRVPLGNLS